MATRWRLILHIENAAIPDDFEKSFRSRKCVAKNFFRIGQSSPMTNSVPVNGMRYNNDDLSGLQHICRRFLAHWQNVLLNWEEATSAERLRSRNMFSILNGSASTMQLPYDHQSILPTKSI
jgi:hypothetical protein